MDRSPYAPPSADVGSGLALGVGAMVQPLDKVDIGAAIGYPFRTPDWWKTCLIAGLFTLIPVVGPVALLGWMRRIFDEVRSGQESPLPEYSFGEDLSRGWAPFAGILSTMGIFYAIIIVIVLISVGITAGLQAVSPDAASVVGTLLMVGGQLLYMGVALLLNVYIAELWRQMLRGEVFPPRRAGAFITAVKRDPVQYLIAALGCFLSGMLGGLGVMLFCVGFLVTLPMAYAMMAHVCAQWDRVASRP